MPVTISGTTGGIGLIGSSTVQSSASGTNIDFTGIPAGVKRITIMFSGVSTNGTSNVLVQIGSGSVVTSGYFAQCGAPEAAGVSTATSTAGFITRGTNATNVIYGTMKLHLITGNTWIQDHTIGNYGNNSTYIGGGYVALSGAIDRVRITTVNGTDAFDAGNINILYE